MKSRAALVLEFYADHTIVTRQSYFNLLNTCSSGADATVNNVDLENKFLPEEGLLRAYLFLSLPKTDAPRFRLAKSFVGCGID